MARVGYEECCAGRQGAGRRGEAEQREAGDVHPVAARKRSPMLAAVMIPAAKTNR